MSAIGLPRAPDAAQRHKRVYARLRRAMALRGAVRCRAGAQLSSMVTGVPVLRSGMKNAASRPGHVIAFVIQFSNSQACAFSRRNASEVCQSLANRARGWSGGRRQGAQWDTLEAGGETTPR